MFPTPTALTDTTMEATISSDISESAALIIILAILGVIIGLIVLVSVCGIIVARKPKPSTSRERDGTVESITMSVDTEGERMSPLYDYVRIPWSMRNAASENNNVHRTAIDKVHGEDGTELLAVCDHVEPNPVPVQRDIERADTQLTLVENEAYAVNPTTTQQERGYQNVKTPQQEASASKELSPYENNIRIVW